MFRSLYTSSSVVHVQNTVNIKIITGLLQCYTIVKNAYKDFYLIIFMAINTSIISKTIKKVYINY